MRLILTILLLLSSHSLPRANVIEKADTLFERFQSHFDFLPEYYLRTHLTTFALHQNTWYRQHYFAESDNAYEFTFLSFEEMLYSVWDVNFQIGLGQLPDNVVFTVLTINFKITPIVELRLPRFNVQTALEHKCHHEVDRSNYPITHWNYLHVACGSKNMRLNDYWEMVREEKNWTFPRRFSWYIRAGSYLREFFGLVSPQKLNGANPKLFEISTENRFAFYRRRSWIVATSLESQTGFSEDSNGGYWHIALGLHSYYRRGTRGATFDIMFHLDDLPNYNGVPRFSKDRLLEIGVSFFN